MDQLKENLPGLDKIVAEIEELASSGGKYQESLEVTLPMVCRSAKSALGFQNLVSCPNNCHNSLQHSSVTVH